MNLDAYSQTFQAMLHNLGTIANQILNAHIHLAPIDWAILSLLLAAAVFGFFKGLINDLLGALVLFTASFVALWGAKRGLYVYLANYIPQTASMTLNIFLILAIIFIIARPIKQWSQNHISQSHFSLLNRTLGAVLGCCKGFAVVVGACLLMQLAHINTTRMEAQALLLPPANQLAQHIAKWPIVQSLLQHEAHTHDAQPNPKTA
jgi:uncharacterized membrane protein required for colicin V production